MAEQQRIKKVKKGVKKKFFEVEVPLTAAKVHLYGAGEEEFEGRVITLDLTRSLRGKSFELKLKVRWDGKVLRGEPVSLILIGSYIRKTIRKGTDYVEDSFGAESKDNILSVKTFLITRNRVSRAVRRSLRETGKKFLLGHLKTRSSNELFIEVMTNKLQKALSLKLKKVYPLALCEIKHFRVEGELSKKKKTEEVKEESKESVEISE